MKVQPNHIRHDMSYKNSIPPPPHHMRKYGTHKRYHSVSPVRPSRQSTQQKFCMASRPRGPPVNNIHGAQQSNMARRHPSRGYYVLAPNNNELQHTYIAYTQKKNVTINKDTPPPHTQQPTARDHANT